MAKAFVSGLGCVEKQTKTVDIDTNGSHEILPDRLHLLDKVIVNNNVPHYDDGFVDGKQAEYNAFWDIYQPSKGEPMSQTHAFSGIGWNDNNFKPKYDICFLGHNIQSFCNTRITDLKGILEGLGRVLDTSEVTNAQNMFADNTMMTRIPVIDFSKANYINYSFCACGKLISVDKIKLKKDGSQAMGGVLQYCDSLETVVFEGTIGQSGLNLQRSTKLSKASIESIIEHLDQTEGSPARSITLSLTAVNNAFEGGADGGEFNNLCASARALGNWTISLV